MSERTTVEVVIEVTHDGYDDDQIHRLVAEALPGMTLHEDLVAKTSAIIDSVETVWVRG